MNARGTCSDCGQFKGWADGPPHKCSSFDEGGFQRLRFANTKRQRQWDRDNKIDIAYRGNELAGEVGEACNIIKKIERERRGIRGSRATLDQLADELADVIICVDLVALFEGIDLWAAIRKKFNETSENNNLDTRIE